MVDCWASWRSPCLILVSIIDELAWEYSGKNTLWEIKRGREPLKILTISFLSPICFIET